jgi:hypothetical protein
MGEGWWWWWYGLVFSMFDGYIFHYLILWIVASWLHDLRSNVGLMLSIGYSLVFGIMFVCVVFLYCVFRGLVMVMVMVMVMGAQYSRLLVRGSLVKVLPVTV